VLRGLIDEDVAPELARALAYDLARTTYRLDGAAPTGA
jgi:hypothetical protein